MKRIVIVLGVLIAAAAVATVTTTTPESPSATVTIPTEAEVLSALGVSFERAQRQSAHDYCRESSSPAVCESQWELAGGGAAIPRTPPKVTGIRTQDRYRVLSLCGTNGQGDPYQSDFPVTREGGSLRPVEPVFWLNLTFVGAGGDRQVARALASDHPPEPCV